VKEVFLLVLEQGSQRRMNDGLWQPRSPARVQDEERVSGWELLKLERPVRGTTDGQARGTYADGSLLPLKKPAVLVGLDARRLQLLEAEILTLDVFYDND